MVAPRTRIHSYLASVECQECGRTFSRRVVTASGEHLPKALSATLEIVANHVAKHRADGECYAIAEGASL